MHLIMLSGGSGKRLWPLSNDIRSKQFIKALDDPEGNKESMVQRVFRQLKGIGQWDSINIVAGASQQEQLHAQLGEEIHYIVEPSRRDTFPAIALACAYLYSEKNVGKEECICVLPVDSYVDAQYFEKILQIEAALQADEGIDLVLLGAVPVKASEKYGYIVLNKAGETAPSEICDVEYFKEKPNLEVAEKLIERNALWNCGVFGLHLGRILELLQSTYGIVEPSYKNILESFASLNKTSFDYEVVEKAQNVKVLKYEGEWKDLGTWETFTEELGEPFIGNVLSDGLCDNTHVINELALPVIAMGLKDMVVVSSHDGLLVAGKGETYKLKELVDHVKNRPMYEERRWGRYIVFDYNKQSHGQEVLTKKLFIDKGKQISYQYHQNRKEIWTITEGQCQVYIEGEKYRKQQGDVIVIEAMMRHGLKAITDIELIEVQMGSSLTEEDITRIELVW